MNLTDRIKALPAIKDEAGSECVSREVVLGLVAADALGEVTAMSFKMVVDGPIKAGHDKFRTEGWLNEGLEAHLKECFDCRRTLAEDLQMFARQIYDMGINQGPPPSAR